MTNLKGEPMSKKKNLGVPVITPSRVPSKSSPKKAAGFPSTRSRSLSASMIEEPTELHNEHPLASPWTATNMAFDLLEKFLEDRHGVLRCYPGFQQSFPKWQAEVGSAKRIRKRVLKLVWNAAGIPDEDVQATERPALGARRAATKERVPAKQNGAKRTPKRTGASRATPKKNPRNSSQG